MAEVVVPRETVNDDFVIFLRWLVPDRARVKVGDSIAEFETSKATVSLEAEHAGYLLQKAAPNDEVPVGAALGSIVAELPAAATPLAATKERAAAGPTFSKKA